MAGSIVVTTSDIGGGYTKYNIAWTSSAGGVVSVSSFDVKRGHLCQFKFIPGTGGTAPTDLYDLTLLDPDGADILAAGANLSGSVPSWYSPANPVYFEGGALIPTIANAGNAKTGTLVLIVGP